METKGRLCLEGLCNIVAEDGNWDILESVEHYDDYAGRVIEPEDAARLVACWNACEGIDTAVLAARTRTQRFPIGQKYARREGKGKTAYTREYTVEDVLRTYNSKGELVRLRYVVSHDFCGQKVMDYDVVDTTIARALWDTPTPV